MKSILKSIYKTVLALLMFLTAFSCTDLTETNMDPNSLDASQISPKFVMTEFISESAFHYTDMVYGGGANSAVTLEAMQYLQRDYIESDVVNTFQWFNLTWNYINIKNAEYLISRAEGEADADFFTAVSLIMKSFWFAYNTSSWGDMPYSEAMMAEEGTFQPVYDAQKDIFKGVLADLETANDLLTNASVSDGTKGADVLFAGNTMRWRQFANSLQLRYLMRLSEKTSDMDAIGVDVKGKFNAIVSNNSKYPIITTNSDNAAVDFPGVSSTDSWPGGPNNWGNRSEFYRRKPCGSTVNTLRSAGDPRLTVWIRPVDVQIVVDSNAANDDEIKLDADGKVKRYLKNYEEGIDTAMYVGLSAAHPNPDGFNKNSAASISEIKELDASIYFESAANPHTSYLADIYQEDTHPLVKSVFISAAEVNFILAEAALKGWVSGSVVDFYKMGISESLDQYKIVDGENKVYDPSTHQLVAFDLNSFLSDAEDEFNNASDKLEPVLTQRWIAQWMSGDSWFSWRRTGLPDLGKNLISGPDGEKIPVRRAYGTAERGLNSENSAAAVGRLSPAVDDQWSKMWLIEGTGKPW